MNGHHVLPFLPPGDRNKVRVDPGLRVDFTNEADIREVCREFIAKSYEAALREGKRGIHAVPNRIVIDQDRFESQEDAARALMIADEELVAFAERKGVSLGGRRVR
jgi:hypothetical protein